MKKNYTVKSRRKREQKTDYAKRLKLLKSEIPRFVVRISNNDVTVQIIDFNPKGDNVHLTINGSTLAKQGYKGSKSNMCSAYLLGLLAAKMALKKNISKVCVDTGLKLMNKGNKIYATIKGAIEGGLDIPCKEEMLPSEERINGKHIEEYSNLLKEKSQVKFSKIVKNGLNPSDYSKHIESVKTKILSL